MWLNKDLLLVVAAGNSGEVGTVDMDIQSFLQYKDDYYTVGAPATFKNGVSVGATQRGEPTKACAGIDGSEGPCSFKTCLQLLLEDLHKMSE